MILITGSSSWKFEEGHNKHWQYEFRLYNLSCTLRSNSLQYVGPATLEIKWAYIPGQFTPHRYMLTNLYNFDLSRYPFAWQWMKVQIQYWCIYKQNIENIWCGLNSPGMYAHFISRVAGPTYCKLLDQLVYTINYSRNSYCQCLLWPFSIFQLIFRRK